jgi:DNA-binding FadR family transcriptional regulator
VPLTTTRRAGLVEQIIDQLRQSVTSGEWAVGTRIPNEPDLSEALGVGRNTLREAVRALAHAGILEVRQGDGTYVRATSEVSSALRRLCGSELREVLQVRRCLEVEGARLAAAARTNEDVAALRQLLRRRDELELGQDDAAFVAADAALHLAVVQASGNTVLTELYRGLTEVVTASVAATSQTHEPREIRHGGLIDAIAAGDVEGAGREAGGFLEELIEQLA